MIYKKISSLELKDYSKKVSNTLYLKEGICIMNYNNLNLENELFLKIKDIYKLKDPEYYYENWR